VNKLLGCGLLLVLLAASAPLGAASHTARGTGKDSQGGAFHFRAEGTPSLASGEASFVWSTEGTLAGQVDCLWVQGRRAVLSGVLDPPPPSVPYFAIMVKDNAKGAKPPKDLFYVQRSSGPYDCATAYVHLPAGLRIKRGEIKVD
jgi:hypothetical protein